MNRVELMGRLISDPKKIDTTNSVMTTFTLAVNRRFAKEDDEKKADFIYCKAWGKTAEAIANYTFKGLQIAVAGRLEQAEFENKQGVKENKTMVVVEEFFFCEKRERKESLEVDTKKVTYDSAEPLENYNVPFETTINDQLPF